MSILAAITLKFTALPPASNRLRLPNFWWRKFPRRLLFASHEIPLDPGPPGRSHLWTEWLQFFRYRDSDRQERYGSRRNEKRRRRPTPAGRGHGPERDPEVVMRRFG